MIPHLKINIPQTLILGGNTSFYNSLGQNTKCCLKRDNRPQMELLVLE